MDQVAARRERLVAFMRLLLAVSGLVVVWLHPSEPDRFVHATYLCLTLYCAYALAIYLASRGWLPHLPVDASHWIDIGWFTILIALGSGTNSIFFFGFFFAILEAAFSSGRPAGLRATFASVALFGIAGYVFNPGDSWQSNQFLIRPVYLLILGYIISEWGGFQLSLLRRLDLLRDVAAVWNPRFGIDRTVANILQRLCAFYHADGAILVVPGTVNDTVIVRRSVPGAPPTQPETSVVPVAAVAPLSAFPPDETFGATRSRRGMHIVRVAPEHSAARISEASAAGAAEFLDAASFVTVPWSRRQTVVGRLFLSFNKPFLVHKADLDFLTQVIAQAMPMVDNVHLVDRLATDAADHERQRIARDLHDSAIQPYIGLRMSLHALREKNKQQQPMADDLARLEATIDLEVVELRRYLSWLKSPAPYKDSCIEALRRYSARYTEATGIAVDLEVSQNLQLNDRLAAEIFQIVVEGLSNVRRHTESTHASVSIRTTIRHLFVRIEDSGTPGQPPPAFTPRSLTERAVALDGQCDVAPNASGGSAVELKIPL